MRPVADPCEVAAACEVSLPDDVDLADGLSEDEAVTLALWNNARFRELLADLGLTRADLIEARQLSNPEFSTMFPVGVKQLEFALTAPLEALWLRPRRITVAQLESQRIADRLVQDGLNLIRDVRVAHADLVLTQDRLRIAEENARLHGRIAELAEARLRAGGASELDAMTANIDKLLEQQQAAHLVHNVALARQHLEFLLGVHLSQFALEPVTPPTIPRLEADVEELVQHALRVRPDLRAAEWATEAACHRAKLSRSDFLRVSGIVPDANGKGKKGFEAGPGVSFTVPIFNHNQGAIARADAELQRARRQYVTLRDQIVWEVRQAHSRLVQAQQDARNWKEGIVPTTREAVHTSERAYLDGGASLLLMLENSRKLLTSQIQQVEAEANLRRAAAELQRSVGWRFFQDGQTEGPEPIRAPQPGEIPLPPAATAEEST